MSERDCSIHHIPLAHNEDLDIWQCVECNRIFMDALDAMDAEEKDHRAGHPHGPWPDCGWCSGKRQAQIDKIEAWMRERRAEWDARH